MQPLGPAGCGAVALRPKRIGYEAAPSVMKAPVTVRVSPAASAKALMRCGCAVSSTQGISVAAASPANHSVAVAPPGRGDEVRQVLGAIREGQAIRPFDTVLQGKDGRGIDISLAVSAIRNATGEVVGAAGIARDISERLQAERKLRESEEMFC